MPVTSRASARQIASLASTGRTAPSPTHHESLLEPAPHSQTHAALPTPRPLAYRPARRGPAPPSPDGSALLRRVPLLAFYVARNSQATSASLLPRVVATPHAAILPRSRLRVATT